MSAEVTARWWWDHPSGRALYGTWDSLCTDVGRSSDEVTALITGSETVLDAMRAAKGPEDYARVVEMLRELARFKDDAGTTPGNWLEGVRQGAIPGTFGSDAITERARLLAGKGAS